MRISLFLLLLVCFQISCTKIDCTSFEGLDWCIEQPTDHILTEDQLVFQNTKDGLDFQATVSLSDTNSALTVLSESESYKSKKGDLDFNVYYTSEKVKLSLTTVEFVEGIATAPADNGYFTIEFSGLNRKKVLRLIKQLLPETTI